MEKIIAWVGTIASIIGAFLVAYKFMLSGYVIFIIGSGVWFAIGIKRKDSALWSLNLTFLIADFIGLYNHAV